MKLVESILTKNNCYKAGKKIKVKGLMLHSVGCPQPDATVFVKNWNQPKPGGQSKCVHGFISVTDGTVYQTLPWDHRGWHGGGSSNNSYIGVETCEPSQIKYVGGATFKVKGDTPAEIAANKEKAVAAAMLGYNSAVELFAMLCKKFNLNPMTDICSHAEGHKKGIASGHADIDHLWRQLDMNVTMDTFRAAVKAEMEKDPTYEEPTLAPEPEKSSSGQKVNQKYKVSITNLRVRSGPGTQYSSSGYTGVGIFTIVEIQNGTGSKKGWGKLKSGAGWISLDYATEI